MKKLLLIILTIIMITAFSACGSDNTVSSSPDTSSSSISTSSASNVAENSTAVSNSTTGKSASEQDKSDSTGWTKVEKSVKVDDIDYTVNGFKATKGSDLFTADDGNTYFLIDVSVKNNTAEEFPISSIMMFELADSSGAVYDISLGGLASIEEEKLQQLDGSVAASSEFRGGLAYEIPENTKGLKLTVKALLGDGDQTVELN